MKSGTASRMKGSTPPMKDRKMVSSGWPRPCSAMMPVVVMRIEYSSGTPASAMTKKTPNRVRASMTQSGFA
jgi:hypothetical protein